VKISSMIASSRERLLTAVKYWNHFWLRSGSVWYSTQCMPEQSSKPTGIYIMSWIIHSIWTLFFCRKSTTLPVTIWRQINSLFLIFTELLLCCQPQQWWTESYNLTYLFCHHSVISDDWNKAAMCSFGL
jgi:hypothetical protein